MDDERTNFFSTLGPDGHLKDMSGPYSDGEIRDLVAEQMGQSVTGSNRSGLARLQLVRYLARKVGVPHVEIYVLSSDQLLDGNWVMRVDRANPPTATGCFLVCLNGFREVIDPYIPPARQPRRWDA
jgi:hypothetical protein